ncbi:hypothetical protein [uncultured Roseobacter sp.]|uniref:tetratricopeptide repeat protein n=1 Tax=uncultured Roseobacter sp. TaxID=114847 RepID=UPI00260EC7FF|nr:hypothetical protein [uncultured Roseobacter sp.]
MRLLLAAALSVPTIAFAAGGGSDEPPKPTTVFCTGSKVYDEDKKKCVQPQESSLERDERYQTVRQLAYAGRYHDAQQVLDTMDPADPGRLTYMGFTHRKMGNLTLANMFYEQAIAADPANILARSYMGQGFVAEGRVQEAVAQLKAIRAHGGAGTWSETSLRNAIATGTTYSY